MTDPAPVPEALLDVTPEELFEDAPCGYVTTDLDGLLIRVNRTFESWTGHRRDDLIGKVRLAELLSAGGRLFYETHFAPLLMMQGSVREVALDVRRSDGSLLPALVNSVLRYDTAGEPRVIRTTMFDATDRRRYEEELLAARRRQQGIARHLQRSMLSGALPEGDGFELGVFYAPAEHALEIGGDWYDAFWLSPETLALVIGDVVGRGIDAAATMGQLRSAVRALAATGLSPAALLQAMDAYCHRHGVGQTTTAIYAQLHVGSGGLRLACAGHPPPAVVEPGAPPTLLWSGRSWPLDVGLDIEPRPESLEQLAPGSTLVFYTDGLIERRGEPLRDGMGRLLAELDARRDAPVDDLVRAIARRLAGEAPSDDVCLLAVRLHGG